MRRLLAVIPLAALLLAGCGYQEMVAVEKCSKVVGEKYYQTNFAGINGNVWRYLVFDDGREILASTVWADVDYNPAFHTLCKTEFVPKDKKDKK